MTFNAKHAVLCLYCFPSVRDFVTSTGGDTIAGNNRITGNIRRVVSAPTVRHFERKAGRRQISTARCASFL